jgi:hypothetical protein
MSAVDWNDPEVKALGILRRNLTRKLEESRMSQDWRAGVVSCIKEIDDLLVELSGSYGAKFAERTRGVPE